MSVDRLLAQRSSTVFIRMSARSRISANLEKAPTLKAEKFNKRPYTNCKSWLIPCFSGNEPICRRYDVGHRGDSTRELTYWLEWQWDWNWNWISKRLPRRRSFLQSILQKPCFVTVLLQNKHTKLAENGENLISATSKKRPLSRSKNLISAQGG